MDASLTHLPPRKQEDVRQLTVLIRDRCPAVEMVILFGSYARGDWKEAKDIWGQMKNSDSKLAGEGQVVFHLTPNIHPKYSGLPDSS